jgi:hypothetical protein
MKKKRTSFVLDAPTREKIRQYQLKHNKSMGEVVRMGIDLLLKDEHRNIDAHKPPPVEYNSFALSVLKELEKYIAPSTAQKILNEVCRSSNVSPDELNPRMFTPEIISLISRLATGFMKINDSSVIENSLNRILKCRR